MIKSPLLVPLTTGSVLPSNSVPNQDELPVTSSDSTPSFQFPLSTGNELRGTGESSDPSGWLAASPADSTKVECLSWNIVGWGCKSQDPDFINFLMQFDIICLKETWSPNSVSIPGYTSYIVPAFKIYNKGRHCSGLCCFIRLPSCFNLTFFPYTSVYIQPFLIAVRGKPILLVNIYIPPWA